MASSTFLLLSWTVDFAVNFAVVVGVFCDSWPHRSCRELVVGDLSDVVAGGVVGVVYAMANGVRMYRRRRKDQNQ